jgi:hypothetical protein
MAGVTNENLKKYGRNIARAMNQTGKAVGKSAGNPFASGDSGKEPQVQGMKKNVPAPDQAIVNNEGTPNKPTKIRGTGAATKGTMARGPMG